MGTKKHAVDLSDKERGELETFISTGEHRVEDLARELVLRGRKIDVRMLVWTLVMGFAVSLGKLWV